MLKKLKKIPTILLVVLVLLTTTVSCAGAQTEEMQTMPQMERTIESSYTDIRSNWAYEAISYVLEKGLFEGTSETTFSPNQIMTRTAFATVLSRMAGEDVSEDIEIADDSANLTREDMSVLLYEYIQTIGLAEEDTVAAGDSVITFTDASKISSDAGTAVSAVTSLGLMSGKSDGSFAPSGTTTRAEAATVIYRLCKLIDEANTSDAFLTELSGKTADIEQYTDYKKDTYQTVTLKSNSISFSGTGATVDGDTITITEAGTYVISGTLKDGQIIVDSEDDENVRLVLNNAVITSSDSSPILVKNAKNTILSIPSGTESVLTDGSGNTDEEATGTLFSADDLWINGSGTLTINANYKDGISGNDDIQITQTKIIIAAVDDGITANDSVSVSNADITIEAGGDGIKSTNDSKIQKGFVAVNGGNLTITSVADGLQAETLLYIQDGVFKIDTSGSDTSDDSDSFKGLKAGCGIVIEDGSFSIDSIDDALHSNGMMRVEGGSYEITTGDDALHADVTLTVSGGTINIAKCYEGIESKIIEITGGTIELTASDDGINVAGGNDSSLGGKPGETTTTSSYKLTISGGDIKVNAAGDGIDVNGSAYMTGGTVLVSGPTNNGNAALDYDGVFEVSGGTLLVAGSSGMAQAPSTSSTQYTIANTVGTQTAGTMVKLVDSSGKTIASFTPANDYQHIAISSPDIKKGSTYTLYAGSAEIETFTISEAVSGDTAGGGGMHGGPGGGGMPQGGDGTPPDGGAPPDRNDQQ